MQASDLRAALDELGMTQAQLAGFLRVTESAVSRWVNAQRPIPGPVTKLIEQALAELGERNG